MKGINLWNIGTIPYIRLVIIWISDVASSCMFTSGMFEIFVVFESDLAF